MINIKNISISSFVALLAVAIFYPIAFIHAQGFGDPNFNSSQNALGKFLSAVMNFVDGILIPALLAIAFLMFVWGVFKFFIVGGSNDEEKEKGKSLIIWAIVGFVLIVSVWGIVRFSLNALGFESSETIKIPNTPGVPAGGSGATAPTSGGYAADY